MAVENENRSIVKEVSAHFIDFVTDWNYGTYLSIGGYGSGKSYNAGALKVVLKCLQERRKVLVVREVYDTHRESTFDLFSEILNDMEILTDDPSVFRNSKSYVYKKSSPMEFIFPNGSRIIFKGMDKVGKLKSLNGVSIVWLEECSEIKYDGYKELIGRLRTFGVKQHFILTCNPVERNNWVYKHFFKFTDEEGKEHVILDENKLYRQRELIAKGVYYHHSTADDNPYLPKEYIKNLDGMQAYDKDLYRIARHGRFGANGLKVLPQFEVATDAKAFVKAIKDLGEPNRYYGLDFGFETSYNALMFTALDQKNKILYIIDELYKNNITDDKFKEEQKMKQLREKQERIRRDKEVINPIIADGAEAKTIRYYNQEGFIMAKCTKFAGSRLQDIKKLKRLHKIICSPKCVNTIQELSELVYKKDNNGNLIYDKFNIDAHTLDGIRYSIDRVSIGGIKTGGRNSKRGSQT